MQAKFWHFQSIAFIAMLLLGQLKSRALAQDIAAPVAGGATPQAADDDTPADVLTPDEWQRVDGSVDRALAWLASQQQPDGSFPTLDRGQPGVTSLCLLAFMAHGHNPGEGQYGQQLERATNFILDCQKPNGLIALYGPEGSRISRNVADQVGVTAAYNHAISSLTLSEMHGLSQTNKSAAIERGITKALAASLEMQRWPKDRPEDRGGWRYVNHNEEADSDLSVTGWQLMFLRSARNAGFNVPKQAIDDAVEYVRRSFDKEFGAFVYMIGNKEHRSRGMAGAGSSRWATPASITRLKRSGPANGCSNTASTITTKASPPTHTTVITTVCSTAAKGCTSWAARIGSGFFRLPCVLCSITSGPTVLGTRKATNATGNLAIPTARHW